MQTWKPKNFKAEYPSPEEGCAFVLGGSLHGEIMQAQPLPRYFRHTAPREIVLQHDVPLGGNAIAADIETYRLEEFRAGTPHRTIWFYIHEGDLTDVLLIRAFTELCLFKRDARSGGGGAER